MPLEQSHSNLQIDANQRRTWSPYLCSMASGGRCGVPNSQCGVKMRLLLVNVVPHGVVGVNRVVLVGGACDHEPLVGQNQLKMYGTKSCTDGYAVATRRNKRKSPLSFE
jgi:hypothetical protein